MYLPLNKTCFVVGFSFRLFPEHNRFKNESPGTSTKTSIFSQEIATLSLDSLTAVTVRGIRLSSPLNETPLSIEAPGSNVEYPSFLGLFLLWRRDDLLSSQPFVLLALGVETRLCYMNGRWRMAVMLFLSLT